MTPWESGIAPRLPARYLRDRRRRRGHCQYFDGGGDRRPRLAAFRLSNTATGSHRRAGSSDVLAALGHRASTPSPSLATCLAELSITFLFAPESTLAWRGWHLCGAATVSDGLQPDRPALQSCQPGAPAYRRAR